MHIQKSLLITYLILIGLIAGVLVGQILFDENFDPTNPQSTHKYQNILDILEFFGNKLFIALLKMVIIPLIMASIIYGVTHIKDFGELGRIGAKTLIYYFTTMLIAVTIGLILVNRIKPGVGTISQKEITQAKWQAEKSSIQLTHKVKTAPKSISSAMLHLIEEMIPKNIVKSASEGKPFPIIFFSLFFGIIMVVIGEKAKPVADFLPLFTR